MDACRCCGVVSKVPEGDTYPFCEKCEGCGTCMSSPADQACPCGGHITVPKFNNRKEAERWLETFQTEP